jgi:tRNA G18 (ribose-2'-O)-methylase SpoU
MDIIYGRNAVKSAIKSGRPIDKLLAAKEIDDPSVREILTLASEKNLPVLRVDKQPIVAAERELFDHGRAVRVDEQPELGLALAQLLFEFGATECGVRHRNSSSILNQKCRAIEPGTG